MLRDEREQRTFETASVGLTPFNCLITLRAVHVVVIGETRVDFVL